MKTKESYNSLNKMEAQVILDKGTEPPFTGEYNKNELPGLYLCRQCEAPLYFSEDKFSSGCGWPSFDDEIPEMVKKVLDEDGYRKEIVCNNCGGHLGHVFDGERFTDKNVRHCVNSISMRFVPSEQAPYERAIFASGCFWGKEFRLRQQKGVVATRVGYTGGKVSRPTYREVSSGLTGHTEAVEVIFDKKLTDFETLAKFFFEMHKATNAELQGKNNDGKYRSAIFYLNDYQRKIADNLVEQLKAKGLEIVTQVVRATSFYKAEGQHQKYYQKLGKEPERMFYEKRFGSI